ncbi:MAGE-domain-containing protein [Aspergillus candidus]|uniref:MAGE-domain-containing protein n=1 Tax=Aspergillus candidus TaxID=41067 RepID=A0A2I2F7J1_ASPCN|nr:MAGE-domain-containing protein [Aspergillus candidus]PLB36599.1 MAGE-domain-containing protein [Aspergillus candidus]
MPHAEQNTMTTNSINGGKAQSHFITHLTSYPIVSDTIAVVRTNKYGAKSLTYVDEGYIRFAKPVLPYLSVPYSYVAPYLSRADALGEQGLVKIDGRFPILKEDTEKIRGTVFYPVHYVSDVRSHITDTYNTEYNKCGGNGLGARGKAVITTGLLLTSGTLDYVSHWLRERTVQAKDATTSYASSPAVAAASASAPTPRQRRRNTSPSDSEGSYNGPSAPSSVDVMVKKLVRLALSSEYARLPIRRTDISAKVLGEQGTRQFKQVFESAQQELKKRFGMEMVELPGREKVTLTQRRAAQKVERPSGNSNKSWVLTSTLPSEYRKAEILTPARAPLESTYTGIYTFLVAIILLNGGSLPEQKLDRYLSRMNADTYTPVDRTDRLLQRLCKEGYLVRTREMDGGEEIIEYMLGPRGKIEVGAGGVAGLVREVYGQQGAVDGGDEGMTVGERIAHEDFEARLTSSLGIQRAAKRQLESEDGAGRGGGGRSAARGEDYDEDSPSPHQTLTSYHGYPTSSSEEINQQPSPFSEVISKALFHSFPFFLSHGTSLH